MPKSALASVCAATLLLAACGSNPPPREGAITVLESFATVTVPLQVEGDQIFVEMDAKRPDGSSRPIMANINMGHANPGVQKHVAEELGLSEDRPFAFTLGGLPITVDNDAVWKLDDFAYPDRQLGPFFSANLKLEGWLQAAVLQKFEIMLDYGAKTLTLAPPGSLAPQGVPVPIRWNEKTGLVSADLIVDGHSYPIVIDSGSGYSWIRPSIARAWLAGHPERLRTQGAVGAANYNMLDYAFEKEGTVLRLTDAKLGPLEIRDLGLLATGPALGWPLDYWLREFVFDQWQEGAPNQSSAGSAGTC